MTERVRGIATYVPETQRYLWLIDVGCCTRWLNDSRRLLFVDRDIRLMDIQSKQHRAVLSLGAGEELWGFGLSPDNRVIYFTVQTSEADIWLLTLRSSQLQSGSLLAGRSKP